MTIVDDITVPQSKRRGGRRGRPQARHRPSKFPLKVSSNIPVLSRHEETTTPEETNIPSITTTPPSPPPLPPSSKLAPELTSDIRVLSRHEEIPTTEETNIPSITTTPPNPPSPPSSSKCPPNLLPPPPLSGKVLALRLYIHTLHLTSIELVQLKTYLHYRRFWMNDPNQKRLEWQMQKMAKDDHEDKRARGLETEVPEMMPVRGRRAGEGERGRAPMSVMLKWGGGDGERGTEYYLERMEMGESVEGTEASSETEGRSWISQQKQRVPPSPPETPSILAFPSTSPTLSESMSTARMTSIRTRIHDLDLTADEIGLFMTYISFRIKCNAGPEQDERDFGLEKMAMNDHMEALMRNGQVREAEELLVKMEKHIGMENWRRRQE